MRAIGLRHMLLAGAATLALAAPGWAQSACEGETLNLLMEQVTDTDAVLSVVPDFEAQTGADVEIEAVNYSLMHEKLVPSLLAAEGDYDVLQVDNYWVGEFVQAGWLEPLDERIAVSDKVSLDRYIPSLLDVVGHLHGITYMLPQYHYVMGLMYRKDIVDDPAFQAAFAEKSGRAWQWPQNLDELVELVAFAQEYTGLHGIAMQGLRVDPISMESSNFLWSNGGDYYDRTTWKSTVAAPEAVHAAEVYATLIQNYAQPGALGANFDEVANVMKQGKAVFAVNHLLLFTYFQNPADSLVVDKMGFTPMPGGTPGLIGAWGWAIPANAANKDCSWEFLEFLESEEIAYRRAMFGGQPTQAWIYEDAAYLEKWPQMTRVRDAIAVSLAVPIISRSTQLIEIWGETMAAIAAGEVDAQSALTEAQAKLDELTVGDPLLAQ